VRFCQRDALIQRAARSLYRLDDGDRAIAFIEDDLSALPHFLQNCGKVLGNFGCGHMQHGHILDHTSSCSQASSFDSGIEAAVQFGWVRGGMHLRISHWRDRIDAPKSSLRLVYFLRYFPYISSSTNSTHLNSSNCAFFSTCRYKGMLIFQDFENTLESSIVAS
jgi:hypothetical protein